jgi:hypothetical protein
MSGCSGGGKIGREPVETRHVVLMVRNYLRERCRVSCQSKLPTEVEVRSVLISHGVKGKQVDEALKSIELIHYGPYISDHKIDVL